MSACCSGHGERRDCPVCGQRCWPVSRQTMLHQVQFPNNQHLLEDDYAFCANWNCTAGYFSISSVILKLQLRAFQPGQQAMLCYCFDITESVYCSALQDGSSESIKGFVVQQTKEDLCGCELRNPSGRCCLASFRRIEKNDMPCPPVKAGSRCCSS